MLEHSIIVVRKELLEALRDTRSLLSTTLYCLMGPGVVSLVFLTTGNSAVLAGMMSVFTLVSAFAGGTNIGMDVLAGERERRSLLPILMNGISRESIVLGKWGAVVCFCIVGQIVTLSGFYLLLLAKGMGSPEAWTFILMFVSGSLPLALLASALIVSISTVCGTVKEAHTYLSMLAFLPMGLGMLSVFSRNAERWWLSILPVVGQQWQMECWAHGDELPLIESLILAAGTLVGAAWALFLTMRMMQRDAIVYGS